MYVVRKLEIVTEVVRTTNVNYMNKLTDWKEEIENLLLLADKYEEAYRMRVCVKCSDAQKVKRNCHAFNEHDSNNNLITSCMHMSRSVNRKLADRADKHIESHPMWPRND